MDILQETQDIYKKSFLSHIFSTTEEGKAEVLNVIQYATMGVIPIVILNKLIHRFIPEADSDKSSLELLVEIFIQLVVMFCGIIVIHRAITYVPSYSGFKYESLTLTNVILAFLILVLSIQTKMGIKVNILFDRLSELWNGSGNGGSNKKASIKKNVRINDATAAHMPSQADYLDNSQVQTTVFPPAPVATTQSNDTYDTMMRGGQSNDYGTMLGPMAANSVLGGAFGSMF
jgi:hypothetical protein